MKIRNGLFGINFLHFLFFGVSPEPGASWAHVQTLPVTFPVRETLQSGNFAFNNESQK